MLDRIFGRDPKTKKTKDNLADNFRCDTCGKSPPSSELAGTMVRFGPLPDGERRVYLVCAFCKSRLGLTLFPSGHLGHGVDKGGHGYVDWGRIKSGIWTEEDWEKAKAEIKQWAEEGKQPE
jgi:hypothetical protein